MFATALGAGALNGLIITKFKCEPLIVTIGTSYIYLGFAQVISQGLINPSGCVSVYWNGKKLA